jgi:hypothetical protein
MITAAIMTVISCVAAADPSVRNAQELAAHGEIAAARGAYQAILDDLRRSGAHGSAALHYDLGTLALSDDDLGEAMLHLLAAQRRAPLDDDIAYNLARAKERRADRVDPASVSWSSMLSSWGERLPPVGVRVCTAVFSALLGLVLVAKSRLGARLPTPFVVALAVAACVALALWGLRSRADHRALVVVLQTTTARSSPDDKADGFEVHPGLSGVRIDENAQWWRVRLENELDVWLPSSAAQLVP